MSLTRRQRALEKLNAVKARKRLLTSQAAAPLQGQFDDVSEVQVGHSKLDNQDDTSSTQLAVDENVPSYPNNITDSPVSSCTDDDEELARKVLATDSPGSSCSGDDQGPSIGIFMPHGGPRGVVDSREDSREGRRNKQSKDLSRDTSQGAVHKSIDVHNESELKIPLRRFDIVEGSFMQKGKGVSRSGRGAHKKSSKGKPSDRHRRSRKTHKDHMKEDDTLSFDSQLEAWMNEGKENPLASALDRVFDYFDEMRSVGDESYSVRTDKSDETVPVVPHRSAGSFFADVEGIFTEGFSCGTLVATCASLNAPTYSFHEDESTLSGTKGSKEALDSNASLARFQKKLQGDPRLEPFLPYEEDMFNRTILTNEESKLPNETKAKAHRAANRKSIDSPYGVICRDMCFVPVECVNESPEINCIGNLSSSNKLQPLVQEAIDQTVNIGDNFKSDAILDVGEHSLHAHKSTSSDLPAPESGSQDNLVASESVSGAVENWSLPFLSGGALLSQLTETLTAETQLKEVGQENEPTADFSNDHTSDLNGETEDSNILYALGQAIKPSASFFSLEAPASDFQSNTDTPKTVFQEAVERLREIKSTPVTDRIREIGDQVKEVLTCSADVNPQDSSVLDVSTNGQTISVSMESLQNICVCSEYHTEGTEAVVEENVVQHKVLPDANVVSLDDLTKQVGTISMDMAKPCDNTDQTHVGTDQPEWKLLQDWHDNVRTERYSADAIAGIVCDDENMEDEPDDILSSTISTTGGISSTHSVSTLGFFEDLPLETEVKPRKKWEPISKVPTGNIVRKSIDVKDGILTQSTMLSPVPSGHGFNDENTPNKKAVIPRAQWLCEQSATQNDGRLHPCHPFISTKAKRQAWRDTQLPVDDFVDIMSANARADDWKQIDLTR